jgi:lipopolysaccharide export system protein LptA
MSTHLRNRLLIFLLASIAMSIALPGIAKAQLTDLRLPISLDADSTDYDGKNSMLMFKGLKLSQGNIGIEADEGRASKLDFEDSVWRFSGNVIIDVENGHIECQSADLQFLEHQLIVADIVGAPATFEMTREGSDETTYAEAGILRYDLKAGTIEFSEDATITEGGNQISSSYLVYNILEQRINAQSSGDGENRVKIVYTPRDPDAGADDTDAAEPPATDVADDDVETDDAKDPPESDSS